MTVMLPSYYVWMVLIIPYVGALVAPLIGKSRIRDYVAVVFPLVSAAFASLLLLPLLQGQAISVYDSVIPSSLPWIPELSINVGMLADPYTIIISNLVAWVSFLVMLYSLDYMKGDSGLTRYWFFMNFFIGSMQLIVLSDNLLSLFIGWEGVGLCSYTLIGYYFKDHKEDWVGTPGSMVLGEEQAYPPSHAGMKAFFMTRIGDISMLAGILILFVYSGTFNYHQLASSQEWVASLSKSGLLVPAALLIFGGAVGKSAQFPLHEWLPDAMAGPAPVSALIHAATMVNAGVVLIARIGPIFYFVLASNPALIQPFFVVVAWVGAFTAFLAATQATVGFELKKILAYSTVSQIGYMMMALGIAGLSVDFAQGLSAGLFQLTSHAIFKAALFLMAGVLIHTARSKYINEMGGLRERMGITFAIFLIAVASLSGIPPLSGFWSKDAVLASAWDSGQFALFIVGVATAGLTAFYSFRMLGIVFFGKRSANLEEQERGGHHIHDAGPLSWVPFTILAAGTVLIGVLTVPFGLEGSLQAATNVYLVSLFPSFASRLAPAAAFNVPTALAALAFALAGVIAAYTLYISNKVSPSRLIGERGFMHSLYKFLENRWYINAIYYKVFVNAPLAFSRWVLVHFELGLLERVNFGLPALGIYFSGAGNWIDNNVDAVANGISSAGQSLSRWTRRIQTGILEQYVVIFAIGLLVLLLYFILTMRGYLLP